MRTILLALLGAFLLTLPLGCNSEVAAGGSDTGTLEPGPDASTTTTDAGGARDGGSDGGVVDAGPAALSV